MSVTWESLLSAIRTRLDEPTAGFWSDDELRYWAEEGLRDVARRLKNLRGEKSYDTVSGQGRYEMPSDVIQIYRVEYQRSSNYVVPLEYSPHMGMDEIWGLTRVNTGTPRWWYPLGHPGDGEIGVFPAPSEALSGGLKVYYYRLPRPIETPSDPVDINAGWQDIVELYVEYNARRKESTDNRWREAAQLYEARLEEFRRVSQNYSDQPQFIGNTGAVPWTVFE